jgi:hypothetical protein
VGSVKQEVTKENKRFKISDVERWVNKQSDRVTQAYWASWKHTAVKLQEEDYTKELWCDKIFELIVINLQDSETKQDESDDQDNNSSSSGGDDNMPLVAALN